MDNSKKRSPEMPGEIRSYVHTRSTIFDGEFDMDGAGNAVLELVKKISKKAENMLNPKKLPEVEFNEEWKYHRNSSELETKEEDFLRYGGTLEYIAWSNYAGGNRFQVSGEIIKDGEVWVFNGFGRFS